MGMAKQICLKDPDEVRVFSLDFTNDLNSGQTISAIDSIVGSPSGLTFASNTIVTGSKIISTKVSGGAAGETYTVTASVTTSDGEELELSGKLQVRNSQPRP